jgi:hypothetical protein
MEDEEKSFKAFKSWKEETEKANKVVRDFYEILEDSFDISKKINNQYDKVYKSIGDSNKELDRTRLAIKEHLEIINKNEETQINIGEVIRRNTSKIEQLKTEQIANNQILEERMGLLREEARVKQDIVGYEREFRENLETITNSQQEISKILEKKRVIELESGGNLDHIKSTIEAMNAASLRGEEIDQEKYNNLTANMVKLKKLQDDEIFHNTNINDLTKDNEKTSELIEKSKEKQNILSGKLLSGVDKYNAAKEHDLNLRYQINKATSKKLKLEKQFGNLQADNVKRQEEVNNLRAKEADLVKEILNLTGKLNLWKLIQLGYERFVKLDKAAEDFRKQTGFSNTQMVELRKNAESINVEFQDMGIGIEEAYSSAKALTDVFGNTALVSKEAMTNVALMSANLNVAVEDSAAVLATFQGLGNASQEAAMNVMKVGAGFSKKAGVPFSLVMKDIANAANDTLSLLGANPTVLMKSAIAARALGTDLNKLVSSQRKLLDFTSSMNDELTLSALLGKNVSLQEVRRLLILGKSKDAAKATLEIVEDIGGIENMNYIQREQLAKTLGMELKDLTKMIAVKKQISDIENGTDMVAKERLRKQTETLRLLADQNDLSKQGVLDARESEIRQQKMQGIMTKLKNTMESIVVSLADILEPIITPLATTIIPIFKFIASIAKFLSPIFKGLLLPIELLAGLLGKVADEITEIMDESKGLSKELTSDLAKAILGTIGGIGMLGYLFFGKGGFRSLMTMIGKPFKAVVSMAKEIFTNSTKKGLVGDFIGQKLPVEAAKASESSTGIKDFLFNLASGLKDMGTGRVLFGAVNLLLATPGLIAMIPVAIAASILGVVGPLVEKGLSSLATGISSMGTLGVLKGVGVIALMGLSILGFAYAMKQFSGLKWEDVGLGILSLTTFTGAMTGLGALVSGPAGALLGVGLLALSGMMLVLSLNMKMLSEASEPLSKISFTNIGSGLLEFGKALTSLASVKKVSFGDLISKESVEGIEKLANMSENLQKSAKAIADISIAAAAFTSINSFADSISKLADSLGRLNDQLGAIKSEELSKLSQIASATTAPNTTTPTANTTLNTSGVENKLDKLTSLLVGGAIRVYLNGKLVNSAMAIDSG